MPEPAGSGQALKRIADIAIAGTLLAAFAPILLVLCASVYLANPGPVFFTQTRIGLRNRRFTMYKLRTMFCDADARLHDQLSRNADLRAEWIAYRRLSADPRIIGVVGAFLRRSSLDEVPQLWNVLRGDMSLVGPRPLEVEVAEQLGDAVAGARATVRPGLTGLWQVSGRSELDLRAMVALDDEYVRQWSIPRDLSILARTPRAVLSRRGAF
jgi:lipopolysaccharide/colanic/teichoic acid biosynthesis glycosyltransferase